MLNADAPLVSIQDLLGHTWIMTTQRYCRFELPISSLFYPSFFSPILK